MSGGREEWHENILKKCLAEKICVPFDQGLAYCRWDESDPEIRYCNYAHCPKRICDEARGQMHAIAGPFMAMIRHTSNRRARTTLFDGQRYVKQQYHSDDADVLRRDVNDQS